MDSVVKFDVFIKTINCFELKISVDYCGKLFLCSRFNIKKIFIQDIDEECRPIDSFIAFVVENDADLKAIFEGKGSALYLLSDPKNLFTKFKQLIDGEKYNVYSSSKTIFIQDIDDENRPINSFTKFSFKSNVDFLQFMKGVKGDGLYKLGTPDEMIRDFDNIDDGVKYRVYSRYLQSMGCV